MVIFLDNIGDFWDQKDSINFYNPVCTQKKNNFITRSITVFLTNVGVFLFRKNQNRKPPERTKNLAEQTAKPIKTHCKPCKSRSWHKKRSKVITMKEILQNWDALQFSIFSSNKIINKLLYLSRYIETSVLHCVPCVSSWLVCFTCWNQSRTKQTKVL